ncbi:MAG: hypothetical protein F6K24_24245 [Okeania sp. SIO2D1]|nr:hypothetical protein [Okeania sp. SIO2D1]
MTRRLEASQNENVGDLPLRRYRWKDLMRKKPLFAEATQNENLPVLPLFHYRLVTQKLALLSGNDF